LRKMNRLAGFVAVATLVLLGHPDTAVGQTLTLQPSPVAFTIPGPGSTSSQVVTVNSTNGTAITTLFVSPISTSSGGNWLSGPGTQVNGNTFTLNVTNTSSLAPGGTYNGTVGVTANGNGGLTGTLNVTLSVGSNSGNGNGLVANPSQISFTETTPGQATPAVQNVSVTLNNVAIPINSVSFTPSPLGGPNFVNSQAAGNGTFNFTVNSIVTTNGFYSGTATLFTNSGIVNLPISLTFGSTSSSLVVNPNPVNLTAPVGGNSGTQNVGVTFNGAPVTITSVNAFTATNQPWLSTSFSGNIVFVSANAAGLVAGNYTGNATVVTSAGTTGFNVNLFVGSGTNANLTATPNPVSFNVQTAGTAPSQNVTIAFNGSPVTVTAAVPSTTTGQNWLFSTFQGTTVTVGVNTAGLSAGAYTGTVTVNTNQGQLSFQVNMTVSGNPTLTVGQTALNFAFQVGTTAPQSQSVSITSNGTPVNFSVTPFTNNGGSGWLVVSPSGTLTTPSTLTVAVQPAGLAAGITYTGGITISTFGGATNSNVTIQVSLLVSNSPILSPSPGSLSFTAAQGSNPPAQTLALASSGAALNYSVSSSITTPAGGIWLQVANQSGTTPGSIPVTVNAQGLAPGTYSGTINLTSQNAGNASFSVPVTLTITAGALLQLTPASMSFAYQIGQAQPFSQTVNVASSSGGPVPYAVTTSTTTGQQWLNISSNSGTTPGSFVVSVNTAGLTAGPYSGTVTVTPNGNTSAPQTIPVTLVVSNNALLLVSPGALTFTVPQGATSSSFQNVALTSTDGSVINFNVGATTTSLSNWLLVNTSSGTTASNLSVSANPNGLAPGTYSGTVTITVTAPATVTNSPQTVPVTLIITPTATLGVSTNSLSFTQQVNGSAPASQAVTVTGSGGQLTFAATATVNQGLNWLSVSPSSGVTTPATLTVTANGAGLSAGTYSGQIVLSSPGAASSQTISVTLVISNSPTIIVSPASLAPVTFQIGSANPQGQTVAVAIAGGGAAAFNATATTANGGNWLSVSPNTGATPQNIFVTINPAGLAASITPYQGTISIVVAGATNSPLTLPIALTVTPAPVVAPTVAGIQNAASSVPTSLSPGLNIIIFGTNMGPATLTPYVVGSNGALATTVAGTQVTFDGIPAPLIYTRNTLVSVMVPYEITGRVSTAMVVTYNGASSAPLQLRVVDSAPGIYTVTQTGTGQGAILNQNGSLNSSSNPEAVGNYIQIFGTGEGQTSPQGVDGAILPNRLPLPAPNLPVAVSIGGIPAADINYAGEAPSLVSGVIQVNAKIPAGVGTGPVPVVITVGGVSSQANVTVSVR
jgi:uncharacterized protein (TIGR03437 family)